MRQHPVGNLRSYIQDPIRCSYPQFCPQVLSTTLSGVISASQPLTSPIQSASLVDNEPRSAKAAWNEKGLQIQGATTGTGFDHWEPHLERLIRRAIFLSSALIAAALAIVLQVSGLFQIIDGIAFDRMAVRGLSDRPAVAIVEGDEATSAADLSQSILALGAQHVVFLSDPDESFAPLSRGEMERVTIGYVLPMASGEVAAALADERQSGTGQPKYMPRLNPVAEYGIYRSQVAWLDAESERVPLLETVGAARLPPSRTYYIPMPRDLSFAVLSPEQVLAGDLAPGDLEGMIVLVATPEELRSDLVPTPLAPNRASVSPAQYSAYAMQSLASGTAATKFRTLLTLALILVAALTVGVCVILTRRRLFAFILGAAACAFVITGGWLVIATFGHIIPFGGMVSAVILSMLGTLMLRERVKDGRLERALVPAIEQSVSHTAFRNRDSLPAMLTATAKTLGIERMLVLDPGEDIFKDPTASYNAAASDLETHADRDLARLARRVPKDKSVLVSGALPSWPGEVRMRTIGSQHEPLYWLYTFGHQPDAETSEFVAANIAQSFRSMQKSHASLSAQQRGLRAVDPVDFRVVNAMELIARHGRQLRESANQLHSAVMFFDIVGFPLHANPQMNDLLEVSGLNPQSALLPEIIAALTDLSSGQSEALLRDVLRDGGEASASIEGLPGVNATLRISAPDPAMSAHERVVVLEAFDTTDLVRLSDLRLAISDFVDVQMRNDLETIALGAALARKSEGNDERRLRMIDKIIQASGSANNRLDAMADIARKMPATHGFSAHPIQLGPIAEKVGDELAELAAGYDLQLEMNLPAVSGYSVGDPFVLSKILEALLRLVIIDSPDAGVVTLSVVEDKSQSHIEIRGGFGMSLERLTRAFEDPPKNEIPEFQIVKDNVSALPAWGAGFTYDSDTAEGYTFRLTLRRIV